MESVQIDIEETAEEEGCACKPYALVRYRELIQQPTKVLGASSAYIEGGAVFVNGEDGLILFIAPLDTVLSIEQVK